MEESLYAIGLLFLVVRDHGSHFDILIGDGFWKWRVDQGKLASLLQDKGITQYVGLDFSSKRIGQAKKFCPQLSFIQADIFECDHLETLDYELIVCTEFLEHVERDLDVLRRIKPGTRFLGTVPNFPYISHVRHFNDQDEVYSRYQSCFQTLRVDTFLANEKGSTFFLLDGVA